MAIIKDNLHPQQADYLRLQDLFAICIGKWKWFVLSLILFIGLAVIYLLVTPPVYTRTTSLLIKEGDKKGVSSLSTVVNAFADMGIFNTNVNVSNELSSIQSPDVILEVIRRLNLDVDYKTDGQFHRETLYGRTLPLSVTFKDLAYNDFSSFTMTIEKGLVKLSDFELNGEDAGNDSTIVTKAGKEVKTPVGKLVVNRSSNFKDTAYEGMDIYVSRTGLLACITNCKDKMKAGLQDERGTIIDISYKDVSIQRAEDFLNTLISVYNENWVKDKNQIAVSTSQFINERLQVIESELGNVDSNISSYKSANLIPDVEASSQMYMNTANEANIQITELNNQLYMARYIRDHINDRNSKDQLLPANSGINSAAIEQQINDYNNKMLQRNSLVANSSEANPLAVDMDKNLAEMRSSIVKSIDTQLGTLSTQIRGLRGIQGASTSRLSSNPKQAKYLLSVERQQKVKESLYLFLLQKREENELSQAFTAYNTRVVTSPTGEMKPTSPDRKRILLAAILLGLLVPVIILYFRENLYSKVRGRKDIENLTLPFIGEIPLYVHTGKKTIWQKWLGKFRLNTKKEADEYKIVVKPGSRNVINEAFRVVRTNMEFMAGAEQANKVMMLTSMNPGSGKTFLTINTAVSFAIKNKKVAVVDFDMRRASLSEYVNKPQTGVSDYLNSKIADWHDVKVKLEGYKHIDIIPVGTIPPNPTELLFSERLQQLINDLRQEYDHIFLDCPPIEIVADASIIAKYADMTAFVIRAGLMEREMLPVVEGYYNNRKFNNMSIILNGTIAAGSRYGYHRYGYSYGYGGGNYGGYTKND
jgi:capsular exopolysaccharide synthesis family protein